jgi:hypothetical protein
METHGCGNLLQKVCDIEDESEITCFVLTQILFSLAYSINNVVFDSYSKPTELTTEI